MKLAQLALSVLCLAALTPTRSQDHPPLAATPAVFQKILMERFDATAHADSARYARFVADEAVFVDDYGLLENAAQHIRTIGKRGVGRSRYTVDEIHVDSYAGFALVNYQAVEHVAFGPQEVATTYRIVETYVQRHGTWLVIGHSEAQVMNSPPPQRVDPEILQDYVGRYEWWPGYVDTITRQGETLLSQGSGDKSTTLNVAASPESFYLQGEPNLLVFVRDKRGNVTHYILHWSDGHITVARKIA